MVGGQVPAVDCANRKEPGMTKAVSKAVITELSACHKPKNRDSVNRLWLSQHTILSVQYFETIVRLSKRKLLSDKKSQQVQASKKALHINNDDRHTAGCNINFSRISY